ncbi:MAG TPA: MMPL family transporter [Candidatus Thermoplasmatota archaeon]|nr:MMPL family transporter [Candidatus Thermoplasmatota archaeon]
MGNIPNKWIGRAGAVVSALISAVIGWFVGFWIGDKLAYGFTFDWYVHPSEGAYAMGDVLPHVFSTAAVSAFLSTLIGVFLTAATARALMKRARYTPPRYRAPVSADVHFGRLMIAALVAIPFLALLLAYVFLASPLIASLGQAPVIDRISPSGFRMLVAAASAFGAGAATLLAHLTTFSGVVSGKIVAKSDRNLIARVSVFGMKHAKTVVVLVLGVTLVAGAYASTITTNVDIADVLPRGDPNTDAAHNLTDSFKSGFTQQVTWQFHVIDTSDPVQLDLYNRENAAKLPNRVTEPDPGNITDELYVRAISETIAYVLTEEPFEGSIGEQDFFKLINWTIAGGSNGNIPTSGDAAFSLPSTDRMGEIQYASVEAGVRNVSTVFQAVDAVTAPNWEQTAVLVTVGADYTGATKHIGERALIVKQSWLDRVDAGQTEYGIFGSENPPLYSVDLPLANAHASELTAHDFKILLPVIALFIGLTLLIAFRNATSVIATFSMLAIAVIWTFGVMGAMGIALNTINLATIPLIMAVGIDYGIHMMNEYQELRAEGHTPEEAWVAAGGGSALALFVGLLTTVAGLGVMIVSPSLLVAQLGILSNIALASCYILSILFIPAIVTLVGERSAKVAKKQEYVPSRIMPKLAGGVSRARWLVAGVMLLLAVGAIASGAGIKREAFGDPPRNWLDDDPLRAEHEKAIEGFYDSPNSDEKANVIIIEGDITDPAVHRYIMGLTSTLRAYNATGWNSTSVVDGRNVTDHHDSRVIADTLKDLPFLVNTYLTVKDGVPGAGQYLGVTGLQQAFNGTPLAGPSGGVLPPTYPTTREEIKTSLDDIFKSPLYQFAELFVAAPEYDMTVIVFSVKAATYDDAAEVWDEVQSAIAANEALKPEGTRTSFFGNTAINYLFVAKQVPWLGYMSIATNVLVIVIVFAFTRDVRVTATVFALDALASTFWIGVLPAFDIGLAINLTLPLVFIAAVGSDYALHLAMKCKATKNPRATFEGVGKGVLFSFVCTFGSFIIFTQISDLAGRRGMIATTIAIGIVFISTLLIVPIFYPIRKQHMPQHGDGQNVPIVETRHVTVTEPEALAARPHERG